MKGPGPVYFNSSIYQAGFLYLPYQLKPNQYEA